jgi:hypothetical protein
MAAENNSEVKLPELRVDEHADGTVMVFDPADKVSNAAPLAEDDDDSANAGAAVEGQQADERTTTGQEPDLTEAEELAAAATEEDRAAIQARRRKERQDKKRRAQERERALQAENAALKRTVQEVNERLSNVERRTTGSDLAQLDNAINSHSRAVEHFKALHAEAINQSNGAAAADAMDKMYAARQAAENLTAVRNRLKAAPERPPSAPNPRVLAQAQSWADKNKWYNPEGKDLDSRITLQIDSDLEQSGFDPSMPEYWQELDTRVAKYLPHRAAAKNGILTRTDNSGDRKPNKSVVTGGGREASSNAGASTGFRLSAERVQALKDAGMWEDTAARNDMIRRYREQDRQAKAGGGT